MTIVLSCLQTFLGSQGSACTQHLLQSLFCFCFFFFVVVVSGAWGLNSGPLARQALCHLCHIHSLFWFWLFFRWDLTFLPGQVWTVILLLTTPT
jgi:hypothetical protein